MFKCSTKEKRIKPMKSVAKLKGDSYDAILKTVIANAKERNDDLHDS